MFFFSLLHIACIKGNVQECNNACHFFVLRIVKFEYDAVCFTCTEYIFYIYIQMKYVLYNFILLDVCISNVITFSSDIC